MDSAPLAPHINTSYLLFFFKKKIQLKKLLKTQVMKKPVHMEISIGRIQLRVHLGYMDGLSPCQVDWSQGHGSINSRNTFKLMLRMDPWRRKFWAELGRPWKMETKPMKPWREAANNLSYNSWIPSTKVSYTWTLGQLLRKRFYSFTTHQNWPTRSPTSHEFHPNLLQIFYKQSTVSILQKSP